MFLSTCVVFKWIWILVALQLGQSVYSSHQNRRNMTFTCVYICMYCYSTGKMLVWVGILPVTAKSNNCVLTQVASGHQICLSILRQCNLLCCSSNARALFQIFWAISLIMAALCSRCGHYIFALWFLLSSFFSTSPNLSRRRLDACHTCTHGVALVRI